VQASASGRMAQAAQNPMLAVFYSFLIGAIALGIYLPLSGAATLKHVAASFGAPWWAWAAGIMGLFYVSSVVILVPRLGVAVTFGLVVAGQMVFSLLMDSNGWLGVALQPISWGKIAGALMLVAGVILMRKF